MNALLFALLSGAASVPPPLPRLRGTSTSDVNEGTSPDIIERAPTQRPTRRPTPRPLLFSSPKSRNCPDDKYATGEYKWKEEGELFCCREWTFTKECYKYEEVAMTTD